MSKLIVAKRQFKNGGKHPFTVVLFEDRTSGCECDEFQDKTTECAHTREALRDWLDDGTLVPGVTKVNAKPKAKDDEGKTSDDHPASPAPKTTPVAEPPKAAEVTVSVPAIPQVQSAYIGDRETALLSRALTEYEKPILDGLPTELDWIRMTRMARAFIASGFAPTAIKSEGAICSALLLGKELGLKPMESLRGLYVYNGRVGMYADMMVALCHRKVTGFRVKIIQRDELAARIEVTRKDQEPAKFSFTMEDATRAELIRSGSGWTKYPRAMLWARCVSEMARAYCPDALGSAYTEAEIEEIRSTETPAALAPVEIPKEAAEIASAFRPASAS